MTSLRRFTTTDSLTLVTLVGVTALTAGVFAHLPETMPTHFGIDGRPNGWMAKSIGAWLLPVTMLGTGLLLRLGSVLTPGEWRERLEASPIRAMTLIGVGSLGALQVLLLHAALSPEPHLGGAVWIMMGFLFTAFGLLMPRVRRNRFFGIRTPWSLASDENWARTHRMGGVTMTVGGLAIALAGVCEAPALAVALLLVTALAPTLWSWRLSRSGV